MSAASAAFGVYVHIPFCSRKCDYCAFATWVGREHQIAAYLRAVRVEIERAVADGLPPVTSLFVGGGTPSLVPAEALVEALAPVPLAAGAEVTVECNPENVTARLLAVYRAAGVNRLSFGVQSMQPHVLASLGRSHDPDSVRRAVSLARDAGFATFNLDLIYGASGETLADWETTLAGALALDPPHVSAYALTVEPGTALAADRSRHPDDDDQADKYLLAERMLTAAGLANYEISNWAVPGHECRHNLLYWSMGEYVGFGCAAHSHRDGRRWWNVRTIDRYLALVDAGQPTEGGGERLDADQRRLEALQLALRLRDGVPASSLPVEDLDGLVQVAGDGRARLTVSGRLVANDLALRLR